MLTRILTILLIVVSTAALAQQDPGRTLLRTASDLVGDGKYPGALRIFEQVMRDYPDSIEPLDGDQFATVYGIIGNTNGHLELSQWMLERFPQPERVENSERTGKAVILVPGIEDRDLLEHAERLTRYAAVEGADNQYAHWFFVAHGVALYRLGKHEEALEWLEKCIDHEEIMIRSFALAYHALALHHLGRAEEAQESLNKAIEIDKTMPTPGERAFKREWSNILAFQIGLKEAQATIAIAP